MQGKRLAKQTLTIAISGLVGIALLGGSNTRTTESHTVSVHTIRVPHAGIQPQVMVGGKGVLHMVYFSGDQGHGDLYYVRSLDQGATFSRALKVNSHPGSAI